MNIYYCQTCDQIIVHEGKWTDEVHQTHIVNGQEHFLFYMDYVHPEFKVCEAEGMVRHRIETLGLAGALETVLF